jgi:hypothetical protein
MKKHHPIRCRCGAFEAELARPSLGIRAICYCTDCQTYAHFLGLPDGMLDMQGGTEIVAVQPMQVSFKRGWEYVECMSLSDRGTLRWYTSCCKTPIGNMPRDIRRSHLGLVHTCLDSEGSSLDATFGPVTMTVHSSGTKTETRRKTGTAFASAVLRYLALRAWSRISGSYRVNPFLAGPSGDPVARPRNLAEAERAALRCLVHPKR